MKLGIVLPGHTFFTSAVIELVAGAGLPVLDAGTSEGAKEFVGLELEVAHTDIDFPPQADSSRRNFSCWPIVFSPHSRSCSTLPENARSTRSSPPMSCSKA